MCFRVDRGQSTPIGTVLLLVIVVAGTTVTVAAGGMTLRAIGDEARLDTVEHAMARFDAGATTIALGRSDARRVTLPATGGGSYEVDADRAWLRLSHVNGSGDGGTDVLANTSLGTLVHEGGATIAYQGGGVWRGTDNGSLMISPPEFRYRGSTLTASIITIDGSGTVGGRASAELSASSHPRWLVPNHATPDDGFSRGLITTGSITVTVHSNHYVAWANYFTQHTAGETSVDHGNRTATMTIIAGDRGGVGIVLHVTETEIEAELG